jgi:V8-like Glu-specific endopeptidase
MDQLVAVNIISSIINSGEKKDTTTCSKGRMTELDDEEESKVLEITYPKDTIMDSKEEEENIELMTSRLEIGSNDVNNTPTKNGSTLYIQHKDKRYH